MAKPRTIHITYLGHASVLVEIDGLRVLTDPLLRPGVGHLRRLTPPPAPAALERIDLVLISHAHHDHLDLRSLRRLGGSPVALCPRPASRVVGHAGLKSEVLAAGEATEHGPLRVEANRAEHDGRRWPSSRSGESLGFVLRGNSGSVYFAGDTGLFDGLGKIDDVGLALLPVAGWGPRLGSGHLDPEDAARAAAMIRPRVAIPIHWGTYGRILMRTREAPEAPARRFVSELAELAPQVRGEVVQPGGATTLALGGPG